MNPPARAGDLYKSHNGHYVRVLRVKPGMPLMSRGELIGYEATRATLRQCNRNGGKVRRPFIDADPFYSYLRAGDVMAPGYRFIRNLNDKR